MACMLQIGNNRNVLGRAAGSYISFYSHDAAPNTLSLARRTPPRNFLSSTQTRLQRDTCLSPRTLTRLTYLFRRTSSFQLPRSGVLAASRIPGIRTRSFTTVAAGPEIDANHVANMGGNGTLQPDLKNVFLGSIDQGTTSSRFLIFNGLGNLVAQHQIEFKQLYPHPGWHEHNPRELVESVEQCIEQAVKKFQEQGHSVEDIKAVGITNQRETTLVWDSDTGEPLYNAIAWPDTRTHQIVRELKEWPGAEKLQERCGLPLSTYPSAVKLMWLLRHVDKVKEVYEKGKLSFGTVDTWLLYHLNGKKDSFVTDATNASRTMFMNLHDLTYSSEQFDFFKLDTNKVKFPKIVPSSCDTSFGTISSGPLKGIRITGCLGDQSAALVGQKGFTPGAAKNTYGTGCFLLYNVGEKPIMSTHGLLATVAYFFGKEHKPVYALEGSIAVAGSAIQYLRDKLGFIKDSKEISDLAASVKDNGGTVFVTAFSGLFAPYWIDDAAGTIFGISQYTERGHIARAALEASCFQTKAILDAMEKDSGKKLSRLAVDGGMSNSDLAMQTQSNLIQIPVDRPAMRETTSLGAAIAAGFATGVWTEFKELNAINTADSTVFEPEIQKAQADKMFKKWEKAVNMSKGWIESDEFQAEEGQ